MTDATSNPEPSCLCVKFVPEHLRIDYDQVVLDEKTGKSKWKTILRAHQNCPEHGLIVEETEQCPED